MSLAWCGCTTIDQTIPEGVRCMGLASCFFSYQIDSVHIVLWVWLIFTQTNYLMVKISWHEFNVVWMWLFSQMAVPDGVQVV